MAGGWGAPINQPMVLPPPPPPCRFRPQQGALPELQVVKNLDIKKPARSALPAIGSEFTMDSGRAEEAEANAGAMGQAFAITRAQNKYQKAKGSARSRQAQRSAEKRKRR